MSQPERLVTDLQAAWGANLESIVLYGSAAAGDFVPGISGHDILIIAQRLDAAQLTAASTVLNVWQQAGNPMPHLMTRDELIGSADVFPIELLDMQQSRRVLFGPDPLADLKIDMAHYRSQVERELRTRLLLFRQKYLACAADELRVARLMAASISTFLVLMRAALRLYNDAVPAEKAEALEHLSQYIPFNPAPFRVALEWKSRPEPPPTGLAQAHFAEYLSAIEQVAQAVDQHLHRSPVNSEKSHG